MIRHFVYNLDHVAVLDVSEERGQALVHEISSNFHAFLRTKLSIPTPNFDHRGLRYGYQFQRVFRSSEAAIACHTWSRWDPDGQKVVVLLVSSSAV